MAWCRRKPRCRQDATPPDVRRAIPVPAPPASALHLQRPMIDAHFHVWQLARGDYGWLTPAMGVIHRDVSVDDWRAHSAPCGVVGGVLVQAAPTEAETRFLLQQAQDADDVLGVVGWVDMLAHDAPARIAELARQPKLKALRPMLQDLPDPDWILQDALLPAFEAMLRCELAFDALVKPLHLPRIAALARRHLRRHQPDLRRRGTARGVVCARPHRPGAVRGTDRRRLRRANQRSGEVRVA